MSRADDGNTMLVMEGAAKILKRTIIIAYLLALHCIVIYLVGEKLLDKYVFFASLSVSGVSDPTKVEEVPTPLPIPSIFYNTETEISNANVNINPAFPLSNSALIIPVAGVKPEQLTDSYADARSEGRVHDAIDIMAPLGTPVAAAADGVITKFFDSRLGGITIYQLTADRKFVLYYAHRQ